MVIGGPLCDVLGMKRLVGFAFVGHIAGAVIYIIAKDATMLIYRNSLHWYWKWNGEKQLAILLLYHYILNNKTTMLNRFHVWFPGGNVIGGLLAYIVLTQLNLDWRLLMIPLFIACCNLWFYVFKIEIPGNRESYKWSFNW